MKATDRLQSLDKDEAYFRSPCIFLAALGKELDYSLELWYNAFSIRVFPIAG